MNQLTDQDIEREVAESKSVKLAPEEESKIESEIEHDIGLKRAGSIPQQLLTMAEKGAQGVLGPIATGAEQLLYKAGVEELSPRNRRLREEANPWESGLSEAAGFIGSAFVPGGQAKVLAKIGEKAAALSRAAPVINRIGSKTVAAAVDLAAFQGGNEVTKYLNETPDWKVSHALLNTGLSGVFGGGLSIASSKFWGSTAGKKLGGFLKSFADHYGGIEGVTASEGKQLLAKSGMDLEAVNRGALLSERGKGYHSKLAQTDTNAAGKELQAALKHDVEKSGELVAGLLGKTTEQIPDKIDRNTIGKNLGKMAAQSAKAAIDPAVKAYERLRDKIGSKKLIEDVFEKVQSQETLKNPYLTPQYETIRKRAGIVSQGVSKLSALADQEGWSKLVKDPEYQLVKHTIEGLEKSKTIGDISALIRNTNGKWEINAPNQTYNRAVAMVADELQDLESKAIDAVSGNSKIPEMVRELYAKTATRLRPLMQALGMHKNQSIHGFPKVLEEQIEKNAEGIFSKLTKENNAYLIDYLQKEFPELAEAVKDTHINEILSESLVDKKVDPDKVIKAMKKLSPQMQQFLMGDKAGQIEAIGQVLKRIEPKYDYNYNHSHSARTVAKAMKYSLGTLTSVISELTGHGHISSVAHGVAAHYLSNTAPDAARLALLKWIGTPKAVEPAAFRAMGDFWAKTIRGESMLSKVSKSVFEAGKRILPSEIENHLTDPALDELSKFIDEIMTNPMKVQEAAQPLSYYMPDEGIAVTSTLTNAANYVSQFKPKDVKQDPLDDDIKPSKAQKQAYYDVLRVANQPLVALQDLKDGTLTPDVVEHIKNMYPQLYATVSQKLWSDMTDYLSKGNVIPYKTKFGLSVFLGQPMDSIYEPQAIAMNQQAISQGIMQDKMAAQSAVKPSKSGMSKMKAQERISLALSDTG